MHGDGGGESSQDNKPFSKVVENGVRDGAEELHEEVHGDGDEAKGEALNVGMDTFVFSHNFFEFVGFESEPTVEEDDGDSNVLLEDGGINFGIQGGEKVSKEDGTSNSA